MKIFLLRDDKCHMAKSMSMAATDPIRPGSGMTLLTLVELEGGFDRHFSGTPTGYPPGGSACRRGVRRVELVVAAARVAQRSGSAAI
jgi:hypothetical protein